jgi:hypothetical protein
MLDLTDGGRVTNWQIARSLFAPYGTRDVVRAAGKDYDGDGKLVSAKYVRDGVYELQVEFWKANVGPYQEIFTVYTEDY